MPPILSKPSKAAFLAIAFVVVGALVMVNTAIYYFYVVNHQQPDPQHDSSLYWCASFFFSGLTLFIIGLAVGRIGRSARHAEMPPEVAPGERTAQPAVTAQPVLQPNGANGQMVMPGQVAMPGQAVAPVPPVAATAPTARVR